MTTLLMAGILVALVAMVAGRKTVARMFGALGAQVNKFGRYVWGMDPVAVYQKQVDDATEEIKVGAQGLEQYRGLVTRLQRQVEEDEREVATWDSRARGHIANNDGTRATDALVNKKSAEASLARNREQLLTTYNDAYQASLKKIQHAQKRIESARREAQRLQADLRMSQAEAEISKLSASFNSNFGALDSLGEAREEIQRQIDSNRAKAQVAHDLGQDGLAEMEAEESAAKNAASDELAKLKAEMNGERQRIGQ